MAEAAELRAAFRSFHGSAIPGSTPPNVRGCSRAGEHIGAFACPIRSNYFFLLLRLMQ